MELTKTRMFSIAMLAIIAAGICVAVAPVAAQSMNQNASTTSAQDISGDKTAQLIGHAFIKVDNETIKFYQINSTLALNISDKFRSFAFVSGVSGAVEFNSTTYTITDGRGMVFPSHHAILDCQGIDMNGNSLNFTLRGDLKPTQIAP